MDKNKAKGNDMEPYKKELKEIAINTQASTRLSLPKVIGQELKDANVKVKDKALQNILSDFIEAAETKDYEQKQLQVQQKNLKIRRQRLLKQRILKQQKVPLLNQNNRTIPVI